MYRKLSFDTLNIIPSSNMYDSNELPPYDKNGNVIPMIGVSPTVIDILYIC